MRNIFLKMIHNFVECRKGKIFIPMRVNCSIALLRNAHEGTKSN